MLFNTIEYNNNIVHPFTFREVILNVKEKEIGTQTIKTFLKK